MARYPERFQQVLVHTGQHYDDEMSQVFFDDLELPQADIYLWNSHAAERILGTLGKGGQIV